MKKVLSIVLFSISFLFTFVYFKHYDSRENEKIIRWPNINCREFVIPNDPLFIDSALFSILESVAVDSNVNIFRQYIGYDNIDKTPQFYTYLLINTDTAYLNVLNINNGRFFIKEETHNSSFYLSTIMSHNENQIGLINDFANNDTIYIYPLKYCYQKSIFSGSYFIETESIYQYEEFLNKLASEFSIHNNYTYNINDFMPYINQEYMNSDFFSKDFFKYIAILYIVSLIFIIFYLLRNTKQMSILKMHGFSIFMIWYKLVGKYISVTFLLNSFILLIFILSIKNGTISFINKLIFIQFMGIIPLCLVSLYLCSFFYKRKIHELIKNKDFTIQIHIFNLCIKIIVSLFIITQLLKSYDLFQEISINLNLSNFIEYSKNYGSFYPFLVGDDYNSINSEKLLIETEQFLLYPYLNELGSLFIDSRDYYNMSDELESETENWYIKSIKINPNYLNEFPIYDINDTRVEIKEKEKDWIILIPEKYQNNSDIFIDYFKRERQSLIEFNKYLHPNYTNIENQSIKIIWIKNNQNIFSFYDEVQNKQNNLIYDAIIQVMTEINILVTDSYGILGNGNLSDPLKIKLIDGNPILTYETIREKLINLSIEDNLPQLVKISDRFEESIYVLKNNLFYVILTVLISLIIFLIIVYQNLIIGIKRNEYKFTVKRLFGYNFISVYSIIYIQLIYSWIFLFFLLSRLYKYNSLIILILLLFIIIESFISYFMISFYEKKNKVNIIKKG